MDSRATALVVRNPDGSQYAVANVAALPPKVKRQRRKWPGSVAKPACPEKPGGLPDPWY